MREIYSRISSIYGICRNCKNWYMIDYRGLCDRCLNIPNLWKKYKPALLKCNDCGKVKTIFEGGFVSLKGKTVWVCHSCKVKKFQKSDKTELKIIKTKIKSYRDKKTKNGWTLKELIPNDEFKIAVKQRWVKKYGKKWYIKI